MQIYLKIAAVSFTLLTLTQAPDAIAQNSTSSSIDASERLKSLEAECAKGDMASCAKAGAAYGRGLITSRDLAKAKSYYQKACDNKLGQGCTNLGSMYFSGEAGQKDDTKARAYMKQACDLGNIDGCANYGSYLYYGIGGPKDDANARKVSDIACKSLSPEACHNFGQMAINGHGGDVDANRARAAFGWACQNDISLGCFNLGVIYLNGVGLPKNAALGAGYIRYSCELKDPLACKTVKDQAAALNLEKATRVKRSDLLLLKGENLAKFDRQQDSFYTFQEACSVGSGKACYYVGLSYLNGLHGTKDRDKAAKMFDEGCRQEEILACQNKILMEQGKL